MKRGYPRPRTFIGKTSRNPYAGKESYGHKWDNKEYPHPYTAEDSNVATIHRGRLFESIQFKRCGTCGEPVEEDLVGLILNNTRSRKMRHDRDCFNSESGPYHLKCLALNFTMCPHLAGTKMYLPAVALWSDVRKDILEKYAEGW